MPKDVRKTEQNMSMRERAKPAVQGKFSEIAKLEAELNDIENKLNELV